MNKFIIVLDFLLFPSSFFHFPIHLIGNQAPYLVSLVSQSVKTKLLSLALTSCQSSHLLPFSYHVWLR